MAKRQFTESRQEMEAVLCQMNMGFLGVAEPGGIYVVPINYAYLDGRLLLHCALTGHKLDCLRSNPAVCFTVGRQTGKVQPHPGGHACHLDSDSVMCRGTARILDEPVERAKVLNEFNRCFKPGAADIPVGSIRTCLAVEIKVTEMTGRRELDRKTTFWRWKF